jgi:hypothetical protein
MSRRIATPIFAAEAWPEHVAVAWVLSRDQAFTQACARATAWNVGSNEAADRRCKGKPVMLFPTVDAAGQRLWDAFNVTDHQPFRRADITARFPSRDRGDGARVLKSIWRADDPRDKGQGEIPLSHAAWWIASNNGTEPFALDDAKKWAPAFNHIFAEAYNDRLPIFDTYTAPWKKLPKDDLHGMQDAIDYPCDAFRSFFEPGRASRIVCSLDSDRSFIGDQYFECGNREPKWRRLMVSAAALVLQLGSTTTKRFKKKASLEKYIEFQNDTRDATGCWASRDDEHEWAKRNHHPVRHVRDELRPRFVGTLTPGDRALFQSTGPRDRRKS